MHWEKGLNWEWDWRRALPFACLFWVLKFAELQTGCFTNLVFTSSHQDTKAAAGLQRWGVAGATGPTSRRC